MGEFDFVDDIKDEDLKRPGFVPLPLKSDRTLQVIECKRVARVTNDGDNVEEVFITARIVDKPWVNQRARARFYVETDNEDKKKGEANGRRAFARALEACGFVLAQKPTEKQEEAVNMGLHVRFDKETFAYDQLVEKFFIGTVAAKANDKGEVWPEIVGFTMVDPIQYDEIKAAAPPQKAKAAGQDDLPF